MLTGIVRHRRETGTKVVSILSEKEWQQQGKFGRTSETKLKQEEETASHFPDIFHKNVDVMWAVYSFITVLIT